MGSECTSSSTHGSRSNPDRDDPLVKCNVELEDTENYIRKAHADIKRSEARTARFVAITLVLGLVVSLPLYMAVALMVEPNSLDRVDPVFRRWYDIVAPLLGAVIGGLFGIAGSNARRDRAAGIT